MELTFSKSSLYPGMGRRKHGCEPRALYSGALPLFPLPSSWVPVGELPVTSQSDLAHPVVPFQGPTFLSIVIRCPPSLPPHQPCPGLVSAPLSSQGPYVSLLPLPASVCLFQWSPVLLYLPEGVLPSITGPNTPSPGAKSWYIKAF